MNLLADESVDHPIVEHLRKMGFSVISIREQCPGVSDNVVLRQANEADALLLTSDKDFGELIFRLGKVHRGVVMIRLSGLSAEQKSNIVAEVFTQHSENLSAAFTVVSPGIIRIRRKQ